MMGDESIVEQGKEYHLAGDWDQALACYQKAYFSLYHSPELNSLIGQILTKQGDPVAAERLFRISAELKPDEFVHIFNYGCSLQANFEYSEAIRYFERALKLNDQSSHAYAEWGHCLLKLKREKEAIKILKKALKYDPMHAATWSDLGVCYLETGKLLDAKRCLTRSDQLRSNFYTKFNLCKLALLKSDRVIFCKNLIEALRHAGSNVAMLESLQDLVEGQSRIEISDFYMNRLQDQLQVTS